jgi:hypothetical protein
VSDQPRHEPRHDDLARQSAKRRRIHVGALEEEPGEGRPVRQHSGPIEYYGPDRQTSDARPVDPVVQYLLGLATPFFATVCGCALSVLPIDPVGNIWICAIVTILICLYLRIRHHWRAFIPGVLTTVLLVYGLFTLCGMIIGSGGFH